MNNTIETAQNYETIKRMLKTFHRNFLTLKHFIIAMTIGSLSTILSYFIYNGPNSSSIEMMIFMIPTLSAIFSFGLCLFIFLGVITQNFINDKAFTLTYPMHYKKCFTDEEQSFLEDIFQDSFENIIKQNREDIINKLEDNKLTLSKKIFTIEYLEAFKKDIEENLEEREQYIPMLKSYSEIYHLTNGGSHNDMLESANQQLSKIGLSTFNTNSKLSF